MITARRKGTRDWQQQWVVLAHTAYRGRDSGSPKADSPLNQPFKFIFTVNITLNVDTVLVIPGLK